MVIFTYLAQICPKPSVRWSQKDQRLMQLGVTLGCSLCLAPSGLCCLWPQDPSQSCILSSISAAPLLTGSHSYCMVLHVKSRPLPQPPRLCRGTHKPSCPVGTSSTCPAVTHHRPHSPCHRGEFTPPRMAVVLPSPTPSFRCWHPTIPRGLDIPLEHALGHPPSILTLSYHSYSSFNN